MGRRGYEGYSEFRRRPGGCTFVPGLRSRCPFQENIMQSIKGYKLLTASAALMAGLACAGAHAADAAVVKLGFAAPLTGPQAHYGEDMKNGLTLALEEANQQAIELDGKTARFELVTRDDQADPRTAVQVAQQIVDEG